MRTRLAIVDDAAVIAAIYNQGIEDRVGTFETRLRAPDEVADWIASAHPVVVAEVDGGVVAFAATFPYRSRPCYAGVAECSVYVARDRRGRGAGRRVLATLVSEAERAGFWKLVSRLFVENTASRALVRAAGFREVGVYEKHGRLDGVWRDVVIVERLIPGNLQ